MNNLREQELELAWLTKRIKDKEDLVRRFETYVDESYPAWSSGVTSSAFDLLESLKQTLYFEQYQLEQLAWDVVQAREVRDADRRIASKIGPLR